MDAGLDGSNAGTALRASMLALNNPAKAQKKIMDELGFSMTDNEGKTKSLSGIIGGLIESTKGMSEADKVATVSKLVGTEATSGFLALMKGGPALIDKNTKALENSGGAAEETAKKMKDGIGGALENLSGAFESLTITIGDQLVPYVQKAAKFLAKLADKFTGLSDKTKKFLVIGTAITGILTAVVAGIGIVLMVVGGAITGLTALAGAMGIAGGAAGLLTAVFAVLTGPIALTVAAVVGLIAIFVLAYKKIDWFREGVDKAWGKITSVISKAVDAIKVVMLPAFQKISDKVKESFGIISTSTSETFAKLEDVIKKAMEISQQIFATVMPFIEEIVKRVWSVISDVIVVGTDLIVAAIDVLTKLLTGDYAGAWVSYRDAVNTAMTAIGQIIGDLLAEFVIWFKDRFEEIKTAVLTKLTEMKDSAMAKFGEWKAELETWFKSIPTMITEQLLAWKTAFTDWFTGMAETVTTKLGEWKTSITEWFASIPGVITEQLILWGIALTTWAEEQNEENKRQFGEWGTAISEWFSSIPAKITEKLAEWKLAITDWFTQTKETLLIKLGEWLTAITEWFTSVPGKMAEKLAEWKTTITNWFTETKESITTNLGEWWSAIGTWFDEAPGKIRTALDGWWTKISTWFSEIPAKITAKLDEWWVAIKTWFKGVPDKPEIKNMGKNLVDKVSEGNEEKKQEFMDKLGQIIVDVALGALAIAGIALVATGRELIKRIMEGVTEMKGSLQTKAGELIDAFKARISEVDLFQIGKDIIQGLIDGIGSMGSGITSMVGAMADLVPQWLKKKLGIASPSKVTTKLGMWTGRGLTEGLAGEISSVARTAQELANASIAKPTLSYDTPGGSYGSFSSALSGSVDVSVAEQSGLLREIVAAVREGQVISLDGRKVGESVASTVKAKNDMISAFKRNGNGGGVYGV